MFNFLKKKIRIKKSYRVKVDNFFVASDDLLLTNNVHRALSIYDIDKAINIASKFNLYNTFIIENGDGRVTYIPLDLIWPENLL